MTIVCLLPAISIIGALTHSTPLLIVANLLVLVAIIVGLKKRLLPYEYYLIIGSISLSLLYQNTLITGQLIGSDIHIEAYFANQTLLKFFKTLG